MLSRSCIAASRCRVLGGARRRLTTTNSSTAHAPTTPPSSFPQNPLQWYATKLDTHPLITKCISSGFIAGSGDRLCQYLAAKKKEDDNNNNFQPSSYDWKRTLRFATLGCFFTAPTIHVWYGFLMSRFPGTGISTIIKRLVCDQGFLSPLFLPTFVSCLTVLEHFTSDEKEGGTIDDGSTGSNNNTLDNNPRNNNHDDDLYSRLQTRLVNDIPELLIVNWSVWIPSMAFMFAFVPNKFQVLFSNCIGFGWNAYLSWRTHEGEAIIDAEEKEED